MNLIARLPKKTLLHLPSRADKTVVRRDALVGASRLLVVATLLITHTASLCAQQSSLQKTFQWLSYVGDHRINQRWGVHFDTHGRRQSSAQWQQWLIRPGVNYQVSPTISVGAAYAYFKSHPYGIRIDLQSTPEHRVHEQITLTQRMGQLAFRHRYRLEQRLIGSVQDLKGQRAWGTQNRFRYMLRTDVPLKRTADERTLVYLGLYNEFLLRFASGQASTFDQNRAYAGIGYRVLPTATIEVGVFNQRLQQSSGRMESNTVVQASLVCTAAIRHLFQRSR